MSDIECPARLAALFRLYAADLERAEGLQHTFRCPLCLSDFRHAPEAPLDQIVAEEHVVPKALGGRIVTLTCRRCNNTHGSALEKHLIQRVRVLGREVPV